MPQRLGNSLALFVFSLFTMLAAFPTCMLPWVASEPDVEWLPILGFMLCWTLACLALAWLLVPALSSAGARLSTLRYAVLDAVAFGFLWLGMGLLLSCAEDGLPVPRILLAVLGGIACFVLAWRQHDGFARWRRNAARRRSHSGGRVVVTQGQVLQTRELPRLPHEVALVSYQPAGWHPLTLSTVSQAGSGVQVLVAHDREDPTRIRDVVPGTLC